MEHIQLSKIPDLKETTNMEKLEMSAFTRIFDPTWSSMDSFSRLGTELDKFIATFDESRDYPLLNVSQGNDELVVSVELPGIDVNDITLTTHNRVLTLTGEMNPGDKNAKEVEWLLRERPDNQRFERTLNLPWNVQDSDVTAEYRHGILTITLPRAEADKPRKIQINA